VLRSVLAADALAGQRLDEILGALNAKDTSALRNAAAGLAASTREALLALTELHGGVQTVQRARRLPAAGGATARALDELEALAARCPCSGLSVDLADLHGYRYYTGATFAAYAAGSPGPLLRGGRYDEIGRTYGRARPATGFSIVDLREAAQLAGVAPRSKAIAAPTADEPALNALVEALRIQGHIVVRCAPGPLDEGGFDFDREIHRLGDRWQVVDRRRDAVAGAASGEGRNEA
jgi:ATP phosphoribosyltransferase regulatory subunit